MATITGTEGDDRLDGTSGDDVINGLGGDDIIFGGGGGDTISGGAGDDLIHGSDGDDTIFGGDGDDRLSGGNGGYDILRGEGGSDSFGGARGLVFGGEGADEYSVSHRTYEWGGPQQVLAEIDLGEGIDNVQANGIDPFLDFRLTFDPDRIGDGNASAEDGDLAITLQWEVYTGLPDAENEIALSDAVEMFDDEGTIFRSGSIDSGAFELVTSSGVALGAFLIAAFGSAGDDDLEAIIRYSDLGPYAGFASGGAGDDQLRGGLLYGGTGDDLLIAYGPGAKMFGGEGDDVYQTNGDDVLTEYDGEGVDRVESTQNYVLGDFMEDLTLIRDEAVTATGNDLANIITGNVRDNVLDGLGGADTLRGGLGDDVYIVDASDTLVEYSNQGFDTVRADIDYTLGGHFEQLVLIGTEDLNGTGNAQANTLIGNVGDNVLDGGGGADRLEGGLGDDTYIVTRTDGVVIEAADSGFDEIRSLVSLTLFDNVEALTLIGEGDLTLTGNSLDNVLTGNAGANVLDGRAGEDRMYGGSGNDYYVFDDRGDQAYEEAGGGLDVVRTRVTYSMQDNIENVVLSGTGNIGAIGNDLNNRMVGNEGNNVLKGRGGNDRMEGGAGDDNYLASKGDKVVEFRDGGIDTLRTSDSWTLHTQLENLTLIGRSNTYGGGNAKANVITGNDGMNTLYGGGSGDTLKGGDGIDTFLYLSASDSTVTSSDRIADLKSNELIDLSAVDADTTLAGDQAFAIVEAFTREAGQMTVGHEDGLTTVLMDIDGDGAADMRILIDGDHGDHGVWDL